jgi:RNA-directed DNA polymerase
MLSTLETGVKGGKWFSLADKAFSLKSLHAAFAKVKANGGAAGVDGMTLERVSKDLEGTLARMNSELMAGTYRPQPVRRVWIPKPGSKEQRPLGIPTVRDRVVQTAVKAALEPIFEKEFCDGSFGFRPGRSCHKALSQVWKGLQNGNGYVVDADIRKFFDSIPHENIMRALEEQVSDGKVLGLVHSYLKQGVMDGWTFDPTNEGTPQGSSLSPLLANIALHGLDVLARERGLELVRYADDFVVLARTREEAESALELVREWILGNGLELHPDKTRIVEYASGESFDFLGFTFERGSVGPRKKSIQSLRSKIRGKTPRKSGKSLHAIVAELNPVLRGWFNYFKPSPEFALKRVDSFVRRRLRAMLDVRHHKQPAHNGRTNQRWPNAFFHRAGLFSMEAAKRESSTLSKANR